MNMGMGPAESSVNMSNAFLQQQQQSIITRKAVEIPDETKLKITADAVDDDFSKKGDMIHRYPIFLWGLMKGDRYIVASTVAIGPYNRHKEYMKKTEEMKSAAAYHFCMDSPGQSVSKVYDDKFLEVAGDVRRYYYDDDTPTIGQVERTGKAEFAAMMFRDACFLLQFIMWRTNTGKVPPSLVSWFKSKEASILKDMFMMDNQIPWKVLEFLSAVREVPVVELVAQLLGVGDGRCSIPEQPPAHLLGLLWYNQLNSPAPSGESSSKQLKAKAAVDIPAERRREYTALRPRSSSAIELAEIGIKLVPSPTPQLKDTHINRGFLFGELSLPPLVMDDLRAALLANMVALELCSGAMASDGYTVSSYVLLLAMLMNRAEDVYELRVKRIVHGNFGDQRTLDFFKILAEIIYNPIQHTKLLVQLDAYKSDRWIRIAVHKFVYKNFKTIVTLFSIIGVLVGIFKALLSMKQHQP